MEWPQWVSASQVTQEEITPERARGLAENAIPSRGVDGRVVDRLAAQIRAGTLGDGDARIIITRDDGRLLAGRRVLEAVIETGIAVTMSVGVADPPLTSRRDCSPEG